jgi:1-acyl-sn-glycerol-3-phosphate acyltransferase
MKRLLLCLHIVSALFQAIWFPLLPIRIRQYLVRQWAQSLLRILQLKVIVRGEADFLKNSSSFLLVANHVSWLDIHVLNAIRPMTFVAKADVSSWPVFGYLAKMLGTIFLEREKISDIKRVIHTVKKTIQASGVVAIFPEGTSSDGRQVLPFKSNLFQSAVDAHCAVLPVKLMYQERGKWTDKVAFVGDMTLMESIQRVLSSNHIEVIIQVCEPLTAHSTRQVVCDQAYQAISR